MPCSVPWAYTRLETRPSIRIWRTDETLTLAEPRSPDRRDADRQLRPLRLEIGSGRAFGRADLVRTGHSRTASDH